MQHLVIGLDKAKLTTLAPHYGLDFSRIIPFIDLYESELLKRQNRRLSEK